jgi:serine/threonine protein kinase
MQTAVVHGAPATEGATSLRPSGPEGGAPGQNEDELGPGSVLKGKYRLDRKLGEGGMGSVYRAYDLDDLDGRTLVAVKLIKPSLRTPEMREALYKEVEITKKIQSQYCIDVYSFEQDRNVSFMVMEYLEGRSLEKVIAEDHALGMPFDEAWPIIKAMANGLSAAHSRFIIHSDFKPANVFITPAGTKVLDFGIARAAGQVMMGMTLAYASYDMFQEMRPDFRDDVYAFGLVVYKLLTGKHPFLDESGFEMRADVAYAEGKRPAAIPKIGAQRNAVLRRALQFERAARTQSIAEVLEGFAPRTRPATYWAAAGVASAVLLGGGFAVYQWNGPQDKDEQFIKWKINTGATSLAPADTETVNQLLELGRQYLADGQKPFNPGLLSENALPLSSALSAFDKALQLDPANRPAAEGMLSIVKLYENESNRLYEEKQFRKADELAKIALKIWPTSVDLRRLKAKIQTNIVMEMPAS